VQWPIQERNTTTKSVVINLCTHKGHHKKGQIYLKPFLKEESNRFKDRKNFILQPYSSSQKNKKTENRNRNRKQKNKKEFM